MVIINRSNQNNKKRRFSYNYSTTSNVILFYEDELCSHSCTEEKVLTSDNSIMHSKLRRSSSKKKNMIEFDPCEDIYEPLDFKNDWSKELKKNYEIHMRNICFNFDSNEPEVDCRRKRCKAK